MTLHESAAHPAGAVSNLGGTSLPLNSPQETVLPRILFIGAGSQGHAYAGPMKRFGLAKIVGICEPIPFKQQEFGTRYIWHEQNPLPHQHFNDWKDFITYETERRRRKTNGDLKEDDPEFEGANTAFVCVLDELHKPVVQALAPLGLHIMCEKPLATSLDDCFQIRNSLLSAWEQLGKKSIFGIGHVLRYSPHNLLLRKIVREDNTIGDIISIEHTEPVGYWHMAHSFVRGNWRRLDTTAPILLTKCCHDVDFIMWMLCSPSTTKPGPPHLPSFISSSGNLVYFRKIRKPPAAGNATNCLSCPIENDCIYSSKKVYVNPEPFHEYVDWPLRTVTADIEDIYATAGEAKAKERLLEVLAEDYPADTPDDEIKKRAWHGRCVWECDNNVCDDQTVTFTWEDSPLNGDSVEGRAAKTATFHMTAQTESICERRGRIYGTLGEITYDQDLISIYSFQTRTTTVHKPQLPQGGGHGGGDDALAEQFCKAVSAVLSGEDVEVAQRKWLGCDLDEIVRSHVAVFAAEKARTQRLVISWDDFWQQESARQ